MSLQTWGETLITSQVDSTALTNTTAATSILPPAARFTLPANYFSIGKMLRLNLYGRISAAASATLTLDVRFTAGSTIVVFNGGSMTLNATATTNVSYWLYIILTCRAIGNSTNANLFGIGQFCSQAALGVGSSAYANDMMLPASAPAVGNGFDSTVSQTVDVFGTWGAASASDSITTHMYSLESMN